MACLLTAHISQPVIPLLTLYLKVMWLDRSTDNSSSWQARLVRNFDGPMAAIAFVGFSCIVPLGLIYQRTINSIDYRVIILALAFASAFAYACIRVEAVSNSEHDGYQSLKLSNHLEVLGSVASKAFIICTLYLVIFSTGRPSVHFLTLAFTCSRMLELYAITFLVRS